MQKIHQTPYIKLSGLQYRHYRPICGISHLDDLGLPHVTTIGIYKQRENDEDQVHIYSPPFGLVALEAYVIGHVIPSITIDW